MLNISRVLWVTFISVRRVLTAAAAAAAAVTSSPTVLKVGGNISVLMYICNMFELSHTSAGVRVSFKEFLKTSFYISQDFSRSTRCHESL